MPRKFGAAPVWELTTDAHMAPGWKSSEWDPVRWRAADGFAKLEGSPIPDHDPADGELILTLPFTVMERIPPRKYVNSAPGEPIAFDYDEFSIETDGRILYHPKP